MSQDDIYKTPAANVELQDAGGEDETHPLSPKGRFGRLSYLAWSLIVSVPWYAIMIALGLFAVTTGSMSAGSTFSGASAAGIAVVVISSIIFAVFGVILMIRRLHDCGHSGWMGLLGIIPLLNFIFFLYVFIRPGNPGSNRFGPARVTRGWEKVLGIIAIFVFVGLMIYSGMDFMSNMRELQSLQTQ